MNTFKELISTMIVDNLDSNSTQSSLSARCGKILKDKFSQCLPKSEVLTSLFPVGAVYMTYNNNNPANFLGGTWVQFGQGRTLIGQGTNSDGTTSMTFNANAIGGEYKHKLTVSEMPSHEHSILDQLTDESSGLMGSESSTFPHAKATERVDNTKRYWWSNTYKKGGDESHNVVQPYIVIYFWRRVA